jgi:predicted nucleic acid-binding protein
VIISDTNILGSFAAARAIPLLLKTLQVDIVYVPPGVYDELAAGVEHLGIIEDLVGAGSLRLIELTEKDRTRMASLPPSFKRGEREAVAIAMRTGATLLSNEKRVVNFCLRQGVQCLDLITLLRYVWQRGVITKARVRTLILRMEKVEGLVIKNASRREVFRVK